MANYVKQTWIDGNPANPTSAARMGVMENGIYDAHFQPAARVFHNAAQSITSATTTAIAFNSERYDTDTIHDTVTNNSRLTCKTAGKYAITGQVEFASSATGNRQLFLRLNGATTIAYKTQAAVNGLITNMDVSTQYDLAVNDYLEVLVWQDSGGSLNVNSSGNNSPEFMMARVA
jgi:Tfp pilus assembly protein FimT